MNINMPEEILFNGANKPAPQSNGEQGSLKPATEPVEASVGSEYSGLIARCLETSEIDHQAVVQAKVALANGELNTRQAAEHAAKNILNFGI